jgi:hypothetical protein
MNPIQLAIPKAIATSQTFDVDYATSRGLLHGDQCFYFVS